MILSRVKWEVLVFIGFVFCEASFRWWSIMDDGSDLEHKVYEPTWKDRVVYWIGVPSYRIGCFFYNLQEPDSDLPSSTLKRD